MSGRPFIGQHSVITNGSMLTSLTSEVTFLNQLSGVSYDISWTGTPVGTFSVQISNSVTQDNAGNVKNPGNWATVPISPSVTASGSADNAVINLAGLECYAIRLVYTRSSGSGTVNATISGKVQ